MLFSVLIANYNNALFFTDCYNSIISQEYENWEVIIVDDASIDNSFQLIQNTIKDDARFKLYRNERNRGCGYTKYRCVELSRGELCGFLDSDDALDPKALKVMVEAHLEHPEKSIINSRYDIYDDKLNFLNMGNSGNSLPKGESYLSSGQSEITHFATFKRYNYDKTIGINQSFHRAVDQDLYYKLEEVGGHLFVDLPLYFYRYHVNNLSLNENVLKARFWEIKAKQNAFIRRKKLSNCVAKNIKKSELNSLKANLLIDLVMSKSPIFSPSDICKIIQSFFLDPTSKFMRKFHIVVVVVTTLIEGKIKKI